MPSTSRTAPKNAAHVFALFSLLTTAAFAQIARSPDGSIMELHGHRLHKRANTYVGCFSSSAPLSVANTYQYQSSGYCGDHCDQAVIGLTGGGTCLCGDQIPAKSSKVDDSKCSTTCDGYPQENCGGDGFYTVYTTGTEDNVPYYSGGSSSSSSSEESSTASSTTVSTATKAPTSTLAVITSEVAQGSTVVITAYQPVPTATDASASSNNGGGGGGTSTAGVAAGVVVGVVALAGIVAGLFFFLRHKKRQQAEADFKQRTQVADFMRGANERKPPGTGYSGMSDQRLDPEAGARRNSVGSLADNQDYSRRILRVANPDSS